MSVIPDEMRNEALKEGVDVDNEKQSTPDAKQVESSTTQENQNTQASEPAKIADSQDPAEKYRREAFKQAGEWKKRYEDLEGRFSKLESTYTNKLESLVGMMSPKQEASMTDQDKQALIQLFKMGRQVPEIAEMLGLDKTQKLEQTLQEERQSRLDREFDGEFDSVVKKWSDSYGLKSDEVKQELLDYINSNDFYGKKSYSPGLIAEAAKSLYFDRLSELQQKKVNADLIREQNLKKQSNTESPSKGKPNKGANLPSKMSDHLMDIVRESGGEIDFD